MTTTPDPFERGDPPGPGQGSAAPEPLAEVEPVPVRVRFERSALSNRWASAAPRLVAVEPGEPGDSLSIRLFRDEAQGYYLNVTTDEPSIFVLWRDEGGEPSAVAVTLSYDEAGRWMDGGETVDRVPMPAEMVDWLSEYVRLHYRPETTRKRRGAKPSFMPRDEFARMAEREAVGGATGGGAQEPSR